MNFAWSEEQDEFRRQTRRWLSENSASRQVRALMESELGFERSQWKEMAQLGWQGMAIPEEFGGAGFGYLELAILFEEMGRTLLPAPFLSTVGLAAPLILELGSDEQRRELLPAIASGDKVVAVAFTEPDGSWELGKVGATATKQANGWTLDGTKSFVIDGLGADDVLVLARAGRELNVFWVAGDDIERRGLETMDMTRKLAELKFDSVRVPDERRLGTAAETSFARVLEKAIVLLANEQVGGAEKCLEMSVEYAKTRHQFGRPIGSFQAIKHKCADMLVQVESAKSAAYYAAWAAAEDEEELRTVAPLAKSYCSEAYFHCAADNIQIHGGIGFTWEHDAHLYFKRAKSSQLLFGDPAYHRAVLADRLGL
jgi:alkylation response protein AidB-like acyl-CoA dehydrogenase